ncbi:MAG: FAD:protein FMN transferase [Myxococcota bacterium]
MADGERTPLPGSSPRTRRLLSVSLLLLAGLTVWRLGFQAGPGDLQEFGGPTMGTTYSVKLVASGLSDAARARTAAAIEERLAAVNRLMSTHDPDSELSRFNRFASTAAFAVSPQTLEVFEIAREVSELTGGAFDVTVGPLVAAWGFGVTNRVPGAPPAAELAALRDRVGYRRVGVDRASRSLSKDHPEIACDLSAIAKGYGVDEVARALVELGHRDFLIEVGGELRAQGQRGEGRPWRVAIERPAAGARSIFAVLELKNASLATSGDYRNYYEQDGVRLSHLIDPRSGRPVAHALASVSVVHADAVRADALATGLAVLGPDRGYALAEREGLAAYFIVREPGGSFRELATASFPPLERPDPADPRAGG